MMKKIWTALLAAVLCCVMVVPASALVMTDEEVQELFEQQERDLERASDYFATRMVWAAAGDDGLLEFGFEIGCPRIMDHLGAVEIEIMRRANEKWMSVKTYKYTDSGMGYLYVPDEGAYTEAIYYTGIRSWDYFAYITVKAEDANGSEAHIMATNMVTAR